MGKVITVLDIRELLRQLRAQESGRAIHRATGLGRPTIAKYRRWAEQEGWLDPALAVVDRDPSALAESAGRPAAANGLDRRAISGVGHAVVGARPRNRSHPSTAQGGSRLHREIPVWRFVRYLTVTRADVTFRVEVAPGAEAQVDFGYAGLIFDPATQTLRRAWVFVMTLSW